MSALTMTRPLLDVSGLTVSFGAVKAVDDVSLTVPPGIVCGLIGPNGSGKTTLLGAISRLVPLREGRFQFEGADLTDARADEVSRAGIARTFQAMRLLGHLTVRENVMVGADFHTAPRSLLRSWLDVRRSLTGERAARALADEALERVGMLEYAGAAPLELPYGMQRRVEIARALATRPRLLLLDEPVAGMNDEERREVSDIIAGLRDEGMTQILVEHDIATMHRVCDLAYVLNFGKVIAHGTVSEVVDVPAVREAYLGHASPTDDAPTRERAVLPAHTSSGRRNADGAPEAPAVELEDICVRYGLVSAVERVSLTVERNGICAVLGANGAGKTSLLTALAGTCPGQVSGTVRMFGEQKAFRASHRVAKDGMVLVPEGRRVFAPLSVEENLLLGAHSQPRASAGKAAVEEIYELFPILGDRRAVAAGLLSGGEQQMLAFGRAMMSSPRVILMDEPSMGLAPVMVDRVMDALATINDRGISILVVEQNAAAVLRVATHAVVFSNGRVVRSGTAEEIRDDPAVARAFLGHNPEAELA